MNHATETKKLNNQGFSLVELIIVVAIMAVLVGVLAPQYLQYVEKSRRSADATSIEEIVNAMEIVASDPSVSLDTSKTYTVISAANNDTLAASSDLSGIAAFTGIIDVSKCKLKSVDFKGAAITLKLEYDTASKLWKVTTTNVPDINAVAPAPAPAPAP